MPKCGSFLPNRGSLVMLGERTVGSPAKVGAKTAVLRGIGNLVKASRGTPESVYSM